MWKLSWRVFPHHLSHHHGFCTLYVISEEIPLHANFRVPGEKFSFREEPTDIRFYSQTHYFKEKRLSTSIFVTTSRDILFQTNLGGLSYYGYGRVEELHHVLTRRIEQDS